MSPLRPAPCLACGPIALPAMSTCSCLPAMSTSKAVRLSCVTDQQASAEGGKDGPGAHAAPPADRVCMFLPSAVPVGLERNMLSYQQEPVEQTEGGTHEPG